MAETTSLPSTRHEPHAAGQHPAQKAREGRCGAPAPPAGPSPDATPRAAAAFARFLGRMLTSCVRLAPRLEGSSSRP